MPRSQLSNLPDIEVDLIPKGKENRPGTELEVKYVTIHNTDNTDRGADARRHALFLRNVGHRVDPKTKRKIWVSWHFTVDDERVVRHLPLNERGIHAQRGNSQSIGIEICMNPETDEKAANLSAARLVAALLSDYKLELKAVVPHSRWYDKKHCPRRLTDSATRLGKKGDAFLELIRGQLAQLKDVGPAPAAPFAPISLPDKDTDAGMFARLLIVESRTPARPNYDAAEVLRGMKAMKAVVHNRLLKPSSFGAPGGKTVLDIVTAPGQFKGFSKDEQGKLSLSQALQNLIDDVLTKANTGAPGKFHEFVTNAINVGSAAPDDPFKSLTSIGGVEVKPGAFGWRTEGSADPGGFFVKITGTPSGLIAGNQFYAVKKNAF
jgi:hypothetical protein